MKITVDLTRLNEALFAARAEQIAAQLARLNGDARPRVLPTIHTELSDGKRELGVATGDLRATDQ